MLDWLRRKIGCVSSHEELVIGGVTDNNINRFRVHTDPSLTTETSVVRAGILEVNDEELIHYQNNREPIKWSYRCLRRYGLGNNTFLFESGRRCSTGPGLFAFQCRRAEILNNIFTEKLRRFASNRSSHHGAQMHWRSDANGHWQSDHNGLQGHTPNRYSDDVMAASNLHMTSSVLEEPYLTPLQTPVNSYANGVAIKCHSQSEAYVNMVDGAGSDDAQSHNYVNTKTALSSASSGPQDRGPLSSSSSQHPVGNGLHVAVREINYADLDLPNSTDQTPKKSRTPATTDSSSIQYVNVNISSDDEADDEAFLPPTTEAPSPVSYVNISSPAGSSVAPTIHINGHANGHANGHSYRRIAPPAQSTNDSDSSTQYTTIDFQKTAAIASSAKSSQPDSSQEGVRKTRHDSSADDLN